MKKASTTSFGGTTRHGEATRAAVRAWGLEIVREDPSEYSNSLTAVFMPEGHNADRLRQIILEHFDMSLGTGLGKLAGKVFRIGHLGSVQRPDAGGNAQRRRDGPEAGGHPPQAGGVLAALNIARNTKSTRPRTRRW